MRKIHMGWNELSVDERDPVFQNLQKPIVYFVHSYHFVPSNKDNAIASSSYGIDFVAAVRKDNIVGLQFHPEKSQRDGLKILENFIGMC